MPYAPHQAVDKLPANQREWVGVLDKALPENDYTLPNGGGNVYLNVIGQVDNYQPVINAGTVEQEQDDELDGFVHNKIEDVDIIEVAIYTDSGELVDGSEKREVVTGKTRDEKVQVFVELVEHLMEFLMPQVPMP